MAFALVIIAAEATLRLVPLLALAYQVERESAASRRAEEVVMG